MRIALISDIHSNIHALNAVVKDAQKHKADTYWLLGDVVDYGANPNEVIEALMQLPIAQWVGGNHDAALFLDVHCSGTHEGTQSYLYTKSILTRANADWLRKHCTPKIKILPEYDMTLLHGTPEDPYWGYLFPDDEKAMLDVSEQIGTSVLCVGHTHRQFDIEIRPGHHIVNPGSVGQPRNGNPKAQYVLFDGKSFQLRSVDYDIESAALAIYSAGLPRTLAQRLYVGL